jgi:hypothetical protein
MARGVRRHADLGSREARRRLTVRSEPYWLVIERGLSLGYRKSNEGGAWIVPPPSHTPHRAHLKPARRSAPQSRAFAWLHAPPGQPHAGASAPSAKALRPGARCARRVPRGSTRFARQIAQRGWPACVYAPSFPRDTTRATGTWDVRYGWARHQYAWLHYAPWKTTPISPNPCN